MAINRNISALKGAVTAKQGKQAAQELNARKTALLTWDKVSFGLGGKYAPAYLWQIAQGKRPPTRRLLLALGIVKPETRSGIRVRMSKDEAMALVRGQVSLALENRIRYQLWGRK
jgi:hypothetical protein